MTYRTILLAGAALAALGVASAHADCADEIAGLSARSGTTVTAGAAGAGVVSKDGSQAPLEQVEPAAGAAASGAGGTTVGETSGPAARAAGVATDEGGGQIAKDGGDMPLGDAATTDTAMSQQDADAQQAGGTTAAAQAAAGAGHGSMSGDAMAALNRARSAMQAGDEAGCMKAIEDARSLGAG